MCCNISKRKHGRCKLDTSSCNLVMHSKPSGQSSSSRSWPRNFALFEMALCVMNDVTFGLSLGMWCVCNLRQEFNRKNMESASCSQLSSCLHASTILSNMRPEANSSKAMVAPIDMRTPGDRARDASARRFAEKSAPLCRDGATLMPSLTWNVRDNSLWSSPWEFANNGAILRTSESTPAALSASTAVSKPKEIRLRTSCARLPMN
mmetsp:Transcript_88183/g.205170  ORF Transcript_88183/g.205170 Transcript_88183/m.205170 type:complete len:206 (-) Transcript_88183:1030-1647(-)